VVWKAKCLQTSEIVAIKQIKFDTQLTKDGFPISALREISVLLHLSHVNIIPVYEMVTGNTPDKVFMVMECMECDLQSAMTSRRQSSTHHNNGGSSSITQPFAQSEIKYMIYQLLCAVSHVHTHWYMHRDIKTSNILIHQSGRLALCDFGLARKYVHPINNKLMTSMVVTLWYRSIELLFGECYYGPEIDIWSVGCVFGELVCMDAILKGNGELDVSVHNIPHFFHY
jgi:cell division cycle 2-like protein